jgi:hypothetical protein
VSDNYERHFSALVERFVDQWRREARVAVAAGATIETRRAAQSTYDAVLWVLRSYGVARLADDWTLPRLAEFSAEQLADLIAAMRRLKATEKWPAVTGDLIEKLESLQ